MIKPIFYLTIAIFLLLGTFDEQKKTRLCRNEVSVYINTCVSV